MTSIQHHSGSAEFPFASLLRSSDRELILVQLMTSVWETILQLPILARDGHGPDPDHRRLGGHRGADPPTVVRREMRGYHAWTGGCAFGYEQEEFRVPNDVLFACLGKRVRLTVLQPRH
jgi:hypothetical protein